MRDAEELRRDNGTAITELLRRAGEARAQAQHEQQRADLLRTRSQRMFGTLLVSLTDNVDWRADVSAHRLQRLTHASRLVGRDTCIEEAKAVLRDRYQITGAQAFELLRHISQTRNRKLHDVARNILQGSTP